MLSLDKEEEVLRLLDTDLPNREIARRVRVSHDTVANLRHAVLLVTGMNAEKRQEIERLLMDGQPIGAIEIRTLVPRQQILAIRRKGNLLPRRPGRHARQCPTCRAIMFPTAQPVLPKPRGKRKAKPDTEELQAIAGDIVDLDDLQIVTHPLVRDLAKRAKGVLYEQEAESD